jgi:hypothetical protein
MTLTRLQLLIFTAALLMASPSRAIVTDPELDFIRTPDDVAAEYGISKKDKIIRLELDLTGDGQPTVFLTYKGTGSRGGAVWTAYTPTSGGYSRADGLQFREDFVRAGKVDDLNPGGGLLALYPGKGAGNLVRYKIEGGKAIQENVQKIDYFNPDHQRLFERVFGRKLGEPMPDDFFKKPPHQVIEVKSIEARATSALSIDTPKSDNAPKTSLPTREQAPTPKKAHSAKPPTSEPSGEPTSSTPWSVMVVLIVAAFGLLWLLVKNRK